MKPYVILNSAMTLDGKITTKTGNSEISGSEDLLRVHKLRKDLDSIMVGINTVIVDDPRLTIHKIPAEKTDNPLRIVVDSRARTPLNSRILNNEAPTLIGGEDKVNLPILMNEVFQRGVKTLMLEGGSTLNYAMIQDGLIDEVRICIAPMIIGGVKAKTLVGGEGVDYMKEAFKLKLKKNYTLGKDLVLEYTVIK